MKAQYIRVSTTEQNIERQQTKLKAFIDTCSGSIPFGQRPQGKRLLNLLEVGEIKELHVHSIDRLGRNTLDIMQTIQKFTKAGVNVKSEKEGLQTITNGKENPVSKLMIGILGTLAEFELNRIRERQAEGIAKAKQRGTYKTNGGKPKESKEEFLNKEKNHKCAKLLKQGESIRRASKLSGLSPATAQKIRNYVFE